MTPIALVYQYKPMPTACPIPYLIQPSLLCFTIMRVALTVSYLYQCFTPRQTGYGDLALQLMLLMCFLLGYTAYL
jgi:4-hydroxybenzoate polyprenyltransferase